MNCIKVTINNIKNIDCAKIEIPVEKGVYSLVGNNGCGKSTILRSLAQIISKHYLSTLRTEDYDTTSYVEFEMSGQKNKWTSDKGWWSIDSFPNIIQINGMYEGSLFYGTRFNDSLTLPLIMYQVQIESLILYHSQVFFDKFIWCLTAERAVRPLCVVFDPPFLYKCLGMS